MYTVHKVMHHDESEMMSFVLSGPVLGKEASVTVRTARQQKAKEQ